MFVKPCIVLSIRAFDDYGPPYKQGFLALLYDWLCGAVWGALQQQSGGVMQQGYSKGNRYGALCGGVPGPGC